DLNQIQRLSYSSWRRPCRSARRTLDRDESVRMFGLRICPAFFASRLEMVATDIDLHQAKTEMIFGQWNSCRRSPAMGLVLTSPGVPLLFMGQEILEDKISLQRNS